MKTTIGKYLTKMTNHHYTKHAKHAVTGERVSNGNLLEINMYITIDDNTLAEVSLNKSGISVNPYSIWWTNSPHEAKQLFSCNKFYYKIESIKQTKQHKEIYEFIKHEISKLGPVERTKYGQTHELNKQLDVITKLVNDKFTLLYEF